MRLIYSTLDGDIVWLARRRHGLGMQNRCQHFPLSFSPAVAAFTRRAKTNHDSGNSPILMIIIVIRTNSMSIGVLADDVLPW